MALIGSRGEALLDTTVRPKGGIPREAQQVHGLADADVASARDLAVVYPDLWRLTSNKTVVAFHAAFDRAVLERECQRRGLAPVLGPWECALERYAEWRGFRASLATICEIEGLPRRELHRAKSDAESTWLLVRRMASRQ